MQETTSNGASTKLLENALRRNELFASLYCDEDFEKNKNDEKFLEAFQRMEVKRGEYIYHQGEDADFFFVVESGQFDVLVTEDERVPTRFGMITNPTTKRTATLGIGSSCGERALMETTNAGMSVRATTDGILWVLRRSEFDTLWLLEHHRKRALRWRQRVLRVIEGHSFFKHLQDESVMIRVVNSFFRVKFKEGETVIHQDSTGDNFYIVDSGELDVYRVNTASGKRLIHVKRLLPGDSIGELAVKFPNRRSDIKVVASTPVSLFAMERSKFQEYSKTGAHMLYERFKSYCSTTDSRGEPLMSIDDFLRCQREGRAFVEAGNATKTLSPVAKIGRRITASTKEKNQSFENVPEADRGSTYNTLKLLFRAASKGQAEANLIDFHDYYHFNVLMQKPNSEYEIAFKILDTDGIGQISREQFHHLLKLILEGKGSSSDDKRIQEMIDSTIPTSAWGGRGYLTYEDFCSLMRKHEIPGVINDLSAKIREEADTWYWQNRPKNAAYSSRNARTEMEARKIRKRRWIMRAYDFTAAVAAGTLSTALLSTFPKCSPAMAHFVDKPLEPGLISQSIKRGMARGAQLSMFSYAATTWGKQTDLMSYIASVGMCGVAGTAAEIVVRPIEYVQPKPGTLPSLLSVGPRWAIHFVSFDLLKERFAYKNYSGKDPERYGILLGCAGISSVIGSLSILPFVSAFNRSGTGLAMKQLLPMCARTVPAVTATLFGFTCFREQLDVWANEKK
jgi:CRP-like cAMP-binding protein/Ca2+-binding EF-hand superfamily protein